MSRPISHLSYKWDALGGDFQPSRCEKTWGTQDPSFSHLVHRPVLPEEGPAGCHSHAVQPRPGPALLGGTRLVGRIGRANAVSQPHDIRNQATHLAPPVQVPQGE
jgi:hypothetical protein